ncbi:MAG: NAD(P)/FAD-dependent oxidoreductase [Gemmatimonadales bacterium]
MEAPPCSVGVVGGGILGMTLALRLRALGCRVTIIEGAAAPGGLASAQEIGGYTWDRFYHVILMSDTHLRGLLSELGLADRLQWGQTRTGFYTDGQLYSLSTSLEFVRFPPLSLVDKARLAATILVASRLKDVRRLEGIPVTDWLERWSGRRTFERIWLPLLKSKLGENYRLASAAFIWAIIARMYAARRSGMKREMFGYVEGGYDTVLRRFRAHLEGLGVEFLTGRPAKEVRDNGAVAEVRFGDGPARAFDRVVLTVACGRIPALCPQLTEAEKARLGRVVYQGVACASLLVTKPLAGYYVTNITEPWVPFTAVIEMTALVGTERFGGHALVYLPRYLTQDDAFWHRSDAEIETEFLDALARMYPDFRRDDVRVFQVARVKEVLALSTLHYTATALPSTRTSLENVFVVNSAQIAQGTLNNNEVIGLANLKTAELAPYLRARTAAGPRIRA